MFVTLLSFSTGLLAHHIGKPEERTAAFIYHGTLVLMTFFYNCVWWYATRENNKLLEDDIDKGLIRSLTKEYAIAPALHLAALIICLWIVPISIIPTVFIYIYFALPRLSERRANAQQPKE